MSDYVTLMGAEQVQSAANQMRQAADMMQRAAGEIEDSFRRHHMFMEDWLTQFRDAMNPEPAAAIARHSVMTRTAALVRDFIEKADGLIRTVDAAALINPDNDKVVGKHIYNQFSYLARRKAIRRVGYGEYEKL